MGTKIPAKVLITLESVLAPAMICVFLLPWFDVSTLIVLWTLFQVVNVWPSQVEKIILIFNLYLMVIFSGVYRFLETQQPHALLSVMAAAATFYFLSYCFIKYLKKAHLSLALLVAVVLVVTVMELDSSPLKHYFYSLMIFWAYNFFILVKEADGPPEGKKIKNLLVSLTPPWNFPFFLNLSYGQLKRYLFKDKNELLLARRQALLIMMRITPTYLILNYILYFLTHKSFVVHNFVDVMLRMKFRTSIFQDLVALNLFSVEGHNYLFALLLGGTTYAVGLTFVVSSGACLICAFGYRVPYHGFSFQRMQTLYGFLSQMYFFYNRSILEVIYPRLVKLYRTFRPGKFLFNRNVILVMIITAGGLIANFMNDVVMSYYFLGGKKIILNTLESIPYFILFSILVMLGGEKSQVEMRFSALRYFRFIFYFVAISFVYSFRRLIFLQTDVGTFLHIMRMIFCDLFKF